MIRSAAAVVAAATVLTLVGIAAASPSSSAVTMKGTVGPGFTINLTVHGKKVKTLPAGRYVFAIADEAPIHNFTLEQESGGKFEKQLTTIPFTGSKTVRVTLKKGKWKYYCMAHESTMFGFFTVK